MPMIGGKFYMNPMQGQKLEDARAEQEKEGKKGKVRHVEVHPAENGHVVHVHRFGADGEMPGEPEKHVFRNHDDAAEFIRDLLAEHAGPRGEEAEGYGRREQGTGEREQEEREETQAEEEREKREGREGREEVRGKRRGGY